MRVNGKETELKSSITLAGFLAAHNYRQIVPRTEFGAVVLQDGDELEIVSFVGGG